ncbi:hypothetical protein A2733_00130 [Candidatus Nomurabacteria bacterium RIFCSPHIGHO2_01_FULL_40_20]|uniref:Transcriptional repressor PaaX-like central Cas2-like domain-containing protein n=1 Tax=Candidatus Nomurabacteria bacterium RIFCSPHIGHO2_01_FULL_40_20 TaxID=1801738 RepID=A0A1F6V426_9BACT|nr:MAG: hypothetical protein A2733_00130 [Candidatus Nomurabacteria bacterium RIFCSPHIGHO2_01_FULL_40_20]
MKVIDKESTKGKILYALGMGVGIAVALSNQRTSFGLTQRLVKTIFGFQEDKDKIKRDLYRLRRQKLVEIKKVGKKHQLVLTEDGREIYLRFDYENLGLKKRKIWDRRWRMILFDIPNKMTKARNAFREKMREMGCVKFNDSVWVYPYPCQEEIDFIANYWKVGRYVHFAVVLHITNEDELCKYFRI